MDVSPIVRKNHVASNEVIQLKSEFYQAFVHYRKERQRLKQQEEEAHQKLSKLIDEDEHLRITYIYLKRMINKTKLDPRKIPKFEFLPNELKNYFFDLLITRKEVKKYEVQIEHLFNQEIENGNKMMINLVKQNQTIQNALMLTNHKMHQKINSSSNAKTMDKVWKVLGRSYAKTAPLSTFTSLSFIDTKEEKRRIELNQSILLKLFYCVLELDEVLVQSSFMVDFEITNDGILVESFLEDIDKNSSFIGNQSRKFLLSSKSLLEIEPGKVLSTKDLIVELGITNNELTLIRKLVRYGYLKHTAHDKDPSIEDLIKFLVQCDGGNSDCLKEIIWILEAIKQDLESFMDNHMVISEREQLLLRIESRIKKAFELTGRNIDLHSTSLVSENYYVPADPHQFALPDRVQKDIETYKEILAIFDHRLLFQLSIRYKLFRSNNSILFNDIKPELVKFANAFEEQALLKDFSNSIFTESPLGRVLNQLKREYYKVISETLSGEDVTLDLKLIDEIARVLKENGVKRRCYDTFLVQQVTKEKYIVNHIKSSYLGNYFRHIKKESQKQLYQKLKNRLTRVGEDIATFSPSYGFNPNIIPIKGDYELVDKKSLLPNQINIGACNIYWSQQENRFIFYNEKHKRFIPIYLGSLASYHLSEDFKLVTYLGQSAFLSGMTIEYDGIRMEKPFVQIGKIEFGSLTLQRRKYIIHSCLLERIGPNLKGFQQMMEVMERYQIPKVSFVRIFLIQHEKLSIIYGEKGLHKPLFLDITEPVFFNRILKHIQKQIKKYKEVAVVFEEALPNPYHQEYMTEISIDV